MLWGPSGGADFLWQASNISSIQPAASIGTTITPGASNVKGSYATVLSGATVAFDVCGMLINFNSNSTAATARDTTVDIGVDPAGGTSFTVLAPDLLASCASTLALGPGVNYYFPIWAKAGSSIGARAAVNNATAGTLRCVITVFGKPRDPKQARVGSKIISVGVGVSSNGTAVTPGTTSDGTFTQLTASLAQDCWWWQLGMGVNDSTMTSGNMYSADLAYGSSTTVNAIIIRDQVWVIPDANESLCNIPSLEGGERFVKNGSGIYVRSQCSGTSDSAISYAAYGVVN